jgi:hypothetical protein
MREGEPVFGSVVECQRSQIDFTLPWPAERPTNDYDHARRVHLLASVDTTV